MVVLFKVATWASGD